MSDETSQKVSVRSLYESLSIYQTNRSSESFCMKDCLNVTSVDVTPSEEKCFEQCMNLYTKFSKYYDRNLALNNNNI